MSEAATPVKKEPKIDGESELQTIANSDEFTVNLKDGTVVHVQKCKLRHAPSIARLASTLLTYLNITTFDALETFTDLNDPNTVVLVAEMAYDPLMDALSELTSLDKTAVEELELDDAILVGAKVVEVNQSFFLNQVKNVLSGLLKSESQESPESKESPSS